MINLKRRLKPAFRLLKKAQTLVLAPFRNFRYTLLLEVVEMLKSPDLDPVLHP